METNNFYSCKDDAINMFWASLIWLIFHDILNFSIVLLNNKKLILIILPTFFKIFWINEIKSQGKTSLVIFLISIWLLWGNTTAFLPGLKLWKWVQSHLNYYHCLFFFWKIQGGSETSLETSSFLKLWLQRCWLKRWKG